MPRITGQGIDNTGSITDSLRTIGEPLPGRALSLRCYLFAPSRYPH
jgi:hypothetical protein